MTLDELAERAEKVASDLMDWASSERNTGPWADEAYRTNLHIHGAFRLLAKELRALSHKEQP